MLANAAAASAASTHVSTPTAPAAHTNAALTAKPLTTPPAGQQPQAPRSAPQATGSRYFMLRPVCRVCGSEDHFQRDCPDVVGKSLLSLVASHRSCSNSVRKIAFVTWDARARSTHHATFAAWRGTKRRNVRSARFSSACRCESSPRRTTAANALPLAAPPSHSSGTLLSQPTLWYNGEL